MRKDAVLTAENLFFRYPENSTDTLKGIGLSVAPGEIYGFLGPSGAGKSTAQKVLIGILRNYRGSARLFGREIERCSRGIYEKIGVSFEFPNMYGRLTALENLRLFAGLYRGSCRDPEELLNLVGLSEHGNRRVESWSKGMKMRLNFCRALLPNPELLFLDEPTSGLDPTNAVLVRNLIEKEREKGTAIFLTTHNMEVAAKLCDRVAFITDGLIAAEDSPRRLSLDAGRRDVVVELESEPDGGQRSRCFALDGIGENADFIEWLKSGKVERIRTLEASLEDVFLSVTGTRISAGEEA